MNHYDCLYQLKVDVEHLKVGMFVGELDRPWEGSPFLFQGFTIEDKQRLTQVQNFCDSVYVYFKDKESYENFLLDMKLEPEVEKVTEKLTFEQELPEALSLFKLACEENRQLVSQIKSSQLFSIKNVESLSVKLVASLTRNEWALPILCGIKNSGYYIEEHPIRVAILSIAFAKAIGLNEKQQRLLATSAILHDIGQLLLPETLLNKTDKLNAQEVKLIRQHPVESYKLLERIEGVSDVVKEVALSHHEREDGKGYPRHIHKDRVSIFAKIVAITDAYDAITSKRPHKPAFPASQALALINKNRDKKFDSQLVAKFVKWIGVMPVGSLVELDSGEVGIVLENHEKHKLKPKLMIITDKNKQQCFQEIIDLAQYEAQSSSKPQQVVRILPNNAYGIKLEYFLEQYLNKNARWLKSS
ncbi:HD-GYP domain-containing protein [Aliikangiella sp. IMCC44632]